MNYFLTRFITWLGVDILLSDIDNVSAKVFHFFGLLAIE